MKRGFALPDRAQRALRAMIGREPTIAPLLDPPTRVGSKGTLALLDDVVVVWGAPQNRKCAMRESIDARYGNTRIGQSEQRSV